MSSDGSDVLLASGSQDSYIRITRFSSRDVDETRALLAAPGLPQGDQDLKLKESAFFFRHNGTHNYLHVRSYVEAVHSI